MHFDVKVTLSFIYKDVDRDDEQRMKVFVFRLNEAKKNQLPLGKDAFERIRFSMLRTSKRSWLPQDAEIVELAHCRRADSTRKMRTEIKCRQFKISKCEFVDDRTEMLRDQKDMECSEANGYSREKSL